MDSSTSIIIWIVVFIVVFFVLTGLLTYLILHWTRKKMVDPMMNQVSSTMSSFGTTPGSTGVVSGVPSGIPGSARIISSQLGGTVTKVIGQPPGQNINLVLEIYPEDGTPYQASTTIFAPIAMVFQYQPGNQLSVLIDPANKANIKVTGIKSPQSVQGPGSGSYLPPQG